MSAESIDKTNSREHDVAYVKSKLLSDRGEADKILENRAWEVFKSKDIALKEKAKSWLVITAMKVKRKLGAGVGLIRAMSAA